MLPIIEMDPSDTTYIYSTFSKQTEEINIPTPVNTFDHPVWLEATEIANSYLADFTQK